MTKGHERRYEIVPQMRDYDVLGVKWHPYIMYFQEPNYRSSAVNTDDFGFRYTDFNGRRISPCTENLSGPTSIVVGGSTAFGVGADDDRGTIASHLSRLTNTPWMNMGGRAFSAFQEFALFAHFHERFSNLTDIVLVSGFNNLYLAHRNLPFDIPLGSFYFQESFQTAMSFEVAGRAARLRSLLKRPRQLESVSRETQTAIKLAVDSTIRSLELWSALAARRGARLTFALQPAAVWSQSVPSIQEAELFALLDSLDPALHKSLERLGGQCFTEYRRALCDAIESRSIRFVDLNTEPNSSNISSELLHVDRVHFSSLGYERVSTTLLELL